jgi:hypothetical protein
MHGRQRAVVQAKFAVDVPALLFGSLEQFILRDAVDNHRQAALQLGHRTGDSYGHGQRMYERQVELSPPKARQVSASARYRSLKPSNVYPMRLVFL